MIEIGRHCNSRFWVPPELVEYDALSGDVNLDRTALPLSSEHIVFRRYGALRRAVNALNALPTGSNVLAVVGASSSKAPQVCSMIEGLQSMEEPCVRLLDVRGHADHAIIREGIDITRKTNAALVMAIGGGTTLDVGKAIAGLALQDGGSDIASFQLKKRSINPKQALPWIAVPTTSGTGSESSNNAVVELGEEKRSIRPIPPPFMILADPSLTDSLPFGPTVVSAIDALAQSLEVFTSAGAPMGVQSVALAAFLNLAEGLKALSCATERPESDVRDRLCWGSLLMGIAFAHAHLGLPHALVHHCLRFGLSHGNMVGILLAPGLEIQAAADKETTKRLCKAEQALLALDQDDAFELEGIREGMASNERCTVPDRLIEWLEDLIDQLFTAADLPTSLGSAGLTRCDLDWIASNELESGASFGIPNRPATYGEIMEVLERAF